MEEKNKEVRQNHGAFFVVDKFTNRRCGLWKKLEELQAALGLAHLREAKIGRTKIFQLEKR